MNNIIILYVSIVSPIILLLFALKSELRKVFLFFVLGATVCIICGEINGFILNSSGLTQYKMTVSVTPLVEETIKALPLIYYVLVIKPKKESIFRCGIALGVGFAVLETSSAFISTMNSATIGWAILRGLGAGLLHSLCGLGLAFGLSQIDSINNAKFPVLLGTFAIIVLFHSSYNILIQSVHSSYGLVLTLFVYLIILIIVFLPKVKGRGKENA